MPKMNPLNKQLGLFHVKNWTADLNEARLQEKITNIPELSEVPVTISPHAEFWILYDIIPRNSNVLFPFVPGSPILELDVPWVL